MIFGSKRALIGLDSLRQPRQPRGSPGRVGPWIQGKGLCAPILSNRPCNCNALGLRGWAVAAAAAALRIVGVGYCIVFKLPRHQACRLAGLPLHIRWSRWYRISLVLDRWPIKTNLVTCSYPLQSSSLQSVCWSQCNRLFLWFECSSVVSQIGGPLLYTVRSCWRIASWPSQWSSLPPSLSLQMNVLDR